MRKLVVGAFLTLDGVTQAPGGPDEDRDGGFRHGGWLVPYFDEQFAAIMTEWTLQAGAFLLWLFPVVLGTGKRLFGAGTIPLGFRLVETRQTSTGAVMHMYERAGGLRYGAVEVGEETVIFDSAG